MTKQIYLDYAAATPLDPHVQTAMQPYLSEIFHNPSATYRAGRQSRQALEDARSRVAHWLGARPSEIIFTAGGTEANNLAIHGVMRKLPDVNVAVSAIEHASVLVPAHSYDYREVIVNAKGHIELTDLEQKVDDKTVLVSIMYANNEVGTIQPLREVAAFVAEIRRMRQAAGNKLPLYLHTDACQAANYLDLHVSRLGVDLLTLNGGKIYGPKQTGALFVKGGIELMPLIAGGGQERGLRSGTENIAGAIGLAAALDLAQSMRHDEAVRLRQLQGIFMETLQAAIPQIIINGSRKKRLPNNVHTVLPEQDNERLLIQLDEAGIQAAAGSACSASSEESSHVLLAMGKTEAEARASLRFTLGRATTQQEVEQTVRSLAGLLSTEP